MEGEGERLCSSLGSLRRLDGDGIIDTDSTLSWLVKSPDGNQLLRFELRNLLLKLCILRAQPLVFFFVFSGEVLQCHATFHLPLLVNLDAGLEFGELGLLSFSESSLGGPVDMIFRFFRRSQAKEFICCEQALTCCCFYENLGRPTIRAFSLGFKSRRRGKIS